MLVSNVFMVAALKFAELMLLLTAAIMMVVSTANFIKIRGDWHNTPESVCHSGDKADKAGVSCGAANPALAIAGCCFIFYRIMHNNLAVNLRLYMYLKSPRCCWACWRPLNVLICKCGPAD